MKIYHIAMAKSDRLISGGERCLIEMVKYFRTKKYKNIIVTTRFGKDSYEKAGLFARDPYVDYSVTPLSEKEGAYHIFIAWIICAIRGIAFARKRTFKQGDIIMSHSTFFPDFLTTYFCKRNKDSPRVYYWNHLIPPRILYGYEGEFTQTLQIPRLNVLFFYINRFIFREFFLHPFDSIITVSDYYKRVLQTKYPNNHIYALKQYGGAKSSRSIREKKKYDVIWLGRFHPQKGLDQFIDIVSRIKLQYPTLRALVIGGGDVRLQKKFLSSITKCHLENEVTYLGAETDRKLVMKYLSQSKVFLMTSTYESFGQVSLEAMKQGLPVVAYDLPPYEPLKSGMITVPILDNELFAKAVLLLLIDAKRYLAQSKIAYNHSKKFSWNKVGKQVYKILSSTNISK